MKKKNLSKLQVRAEVLSVLTQLYTLKNASRETQFKQFKKLKSIENLDYVLECLLRELPKTSYEQRHIIAQLLIEFGDLDKLKNPLWALIKDQSISDEVKDTANAILRNLGDSTDPDHYLNYLDNPNDLINKETERMLDIATQDLEVQVDFLDFLFSLPTEEQINLIESLKSDYPGEKLVPILIPFLETRPKEDLSYLLIESLGVTKSSQALQYLEEIYNYAENETKKKIIKKSINMLMLSGARQKKPHTHTALENSKIFKCYASPIDGIGNQGIIISREKNNTDISLFSTVINDTHGIMDCFGFNQVTQQDFDRIIGKFQESSLTTTIPSDYCKWRLLTAEKLNIANNNSIPYEYAIWKTLASDVNNFSGDLENLINQHKDDSLIPKLNEIYKISDFFCWFIENNDYPDIDDFFEINQVYFLTSIKSKKPDIEIINNYFTQKIKEVIEKLFIPIVRNTYYERLLNMLYLLNIHNLELETRLVATAAYALSEKSNIPISENTFIIALMQKSLLENLVKYEHAITNYKENRNDNEYIKIYKETLYTLFNRWQLNY